MLRIWAEEEGGSGDDPFLSSRTPEWRPSPITAQPMGLGIKKRLN